MELATGNKNNFSEEEFMDKYRSWARRNQISQDPDEKEHFYDYRAAFKADPKVFETDGHLPSEFKLEGHPRMVLPSEENPDVLINTKTGEPVEKSSPKKPLSVLDRFLQNKKNQTKLKESLELSKIAKENDYSNFDALLSNMYDTAVFQIPSNFYSFRGAVRDVAEEYLGFDEFVGREESYRALGYDPDKLTDIERNRLDKMSRADIDRAISKRLEKREIGIGDVANPFEIGDVQNQTLTPKEQEMLQPKGQGTLAGDIGSGLVYFAPSVAAVLTSAVAAVPAAATAAIGGLVQLGMGVISGGSEIKELRRTAEEAGELDLLSNEKELLVGVAAGFIEAIGTRIGIKGLSKVVKPSQSQALQLGKTVNAYNKGRVGASQLKNAFRKATGKNLATGVITEAAEEGMVEVVTSGLRAVADYGPDRTIGEILSDAGRAATVGGILGAGIPTVQGAGRELGMGQMSARAQLSPEEYNALSEEERIAYDTDTSRLGSDAFLLQQELIQRQNDGLHQALKQDRRNANKTVANYQPMQQREEAEEAIPEDLESAAKQIEFEKDELVDQSQGKLKDQNRKIKVRERAEITAEQQAFADMAQETFGKKVVFFETGSVELENDQEVDGSFEPELVRAQGFVGSSGNTIYLHADKSVRNGLHNVFTHEAIHQLEREDAEVFEDLTQMFSKSAELLGENYFANKYSTQMMGYLGQGMSFSDAIRKVMREQGVDANGNTDKLGSDVVSEGMAELFSNQEALKAAGVGSWLNANTGKAARIRDWFKRTFVKNGLAGTQLERNILEFIQTQRTNTPVQMAKAESDVLEEKSGIKFNLAFTDEGQRQVKKGATKSLKAQTKRVRDRLEGDDLFPVKETEILTKEEIDYIDKPLESFADLEFGDELNKEVRDWYRDTAILDDDISSATMDQIFTADKDTKLKSRARQSVLNLQTKQKRMTKGDFLKSIKGGNYRLSDAEIAYSGLDAYFYGMPDDQVVDLEELLKIMNRDGLVFSTTVQGERKTEIERGKVEREVLTEQSRNALLDKYLTYLTKKMPELKDISKEVYGSGISYYTTTVENFHGIDFTNEAIEEARKAYDAKETGKDFDSLDEDTADALIELANLVVIKKYPLYGYENRFSNNTVPLGKTKQEAKKRYIESIRETIEGDNTALQNSKLTGFARKNGFTNLIEMKEESDTERFRQEIEQSKRYEEEPQYEDQYNLESNKILRSPRTKRSDVTTLFDPRTYEETIVSMSNIPAMPSKLQAALQMESLFDVDRRLNRLTVPRSGLDPILQTGRIELENFEPFSAYHTQRDTKRIRESSKGFDLQPDYAPDIYEGHLSDNRMSGTLGWRRTQVYTLKNTDGETLGNTLHVAEIQSDSAKKDAQAKQSKNTVAEITADQVNSLYEFRRDGEKLLGAREDVYDAAVINARKMFKNKLTNEVLYKNISNSNAEFNIDENADKNKQIEKETKFLSKIKGDNISSTMYASDAESEITFEDNVKKDAAQYTKDNRFDGTDVYEQWAADWVQRFRNDHKLVDDDGVKTFVDVDSQELFEAIFKPHVRKGTVQPVKFVASGKINTEFPQFFSTKQPVKPPSVSVRVRSYQQKTENGAEIPSGIADFTVKIPVTKLLSRKDMMGFLEASTFFDSSLQQVKQDFNESNPTSGTPFNDGELIEKGRLQSPAGTTWYKPVIMEMFTDAIRKDVDYISFDTEKIIAARNNNPIRNIKEVLVTRGEQDQAEGASIKSITGTDKFKYSGIEGMRLVYKTDDGLFGVRKFTDTPYKLLSTNGIKTKEDMLIKQLLPIMDRESAVRIVESITDKTQSEEFKKQTKPFIDEFNEEGRTMLDDAVPAGYVADFNGTIGGLGYKNLYSDIYKFVNKYSKQNGGETLQKLKQPARFKEATTDDHILTLKLTPEFKKHIKEDLLPVAFSVSPFGTDASKAEIMNMLPTITNADNIDEFAIKTALSDLSPDVLDKAKVKELLNEKYSGVLNEDQMDSLVAQVNTTNLKPIEFQLMGFQNWAVNKMFKKKADEYQGLGMRIEDKWFKKSGEEIQIRDINKVHSKVLAKLKEDGSKRAKAVLMAMQGKSPIEIAVALKDEKAAKYGIRVAENAYYGRYDAYLNRKVNAAIREEVRDIKQRENIRKTYRAMMAKQRIQMGKAAAEKLHNTHEKFKKGLLSTAQFQDELRSMLKLYVPPKMRGAYIQAISQIGSYRVKDKETGEFRLVQRTEKGKVAQGSKIMRRIMMDRLRNEYRDSVSTLRKNIRASKKILKKKTFKQEDKADLLSMLEKAEKFNKLTAKAKGPDDFKMLIDSVEEVNRELAGTFIDAKERIGEQVMENKNTIAENRRLSSEEINNQIDNQKRKKLNKVGERTNRSFMRNWIGRARDLRGNMLLLSGSRDSVLYKSVVTTLRKAEEKAIAKRDNAIKRLDQAARKAGYRGLAELRQRAGEHDGSARVDYFDITLGGKSYKITLGQALHLMALDPQTKARLSRTSKEGEFVGAPIALDRIERSEDIKNAGADIDRFVNKLLKEKPQLIELVTEMKQILETQRVDLFNAKATLEGVEPEAVPDYWPISVIRQGTGNATLEDIIGKGSAGFKVLLTDTGLLTSRKENSSPVLIKDAVQTFLDHSHESSFLSEFAVPAYNAVALLNDPQIKETIQTTYGEDTYNLIVEQILNSTRLKVGQQTERTWLDHILRNASASYLVSNEGTWYRMGFGGIASLMFKASPTKIFRAMADTAVTAVGSERLNEMLDASPYIADRLFGNDGYGRHSSNAYGDSRLESASNARIVDTESLVSGTMQFAAAMNPANKMNLPTRRQSIYKAMASMRNSIRVLQGIDSYVCLTAYNLHRNEAERVMPDATEEAKIAYAGEKASETLRETQNVTSPMDDAGWATLAKRKGSLARSLLWFSSDPMKKTAMFLDALDTGDPLQIGKSFLAVSSNMGVNLGTRTFAAMPLTHLLLSVFGSDEEDIVDLIAAESKRSRRQYRGFVSDTLSLLPMAEVGSGAVLKTTNQIARVLQEKGAIESVPEFMEMNTFFTQSFNVGGIETVDEALTAFGNLIKADAETKGTDIAKAINEISVLAGNPFYSVLNKVIREIDNIKDPDEKIERLYREYNKAIRNNPEIEFPKEMTNFISEFSKYKRDTSSAEKKYEKKPKSLENKKEKIIKRYQDRVAPLYDQIKNFDWREEK